MEATSLRWRFQRQEDETKQLKVNDLARTHGAVVDPRMVDGGDVAGPELQNFLRPGM